MRYYVVAEAGLWYVIEQGTGRKVFGTAIHAAAVRVEQTLNQEHHIWSEQTYTMMLEARATG